ncbi:sn-glycerol-3-phosphate transport system permease protein UgpA [Calidithermus terrae]|uniref:sn-glycerol-3-phosphate transport system permease protein UgpA n=1 Tax=Calidithermus terrae TaxID=1408545 RepID=A0A399F7B1_9DEIN|nr:sugar ABC transporter permease [Calidithermus terrae]RIH90511.1 sn-glycerol-3-phosphate transport system permease protein UgpA [Calidithermus terrae]
MEQVPETGTVQRPGRVASSWRRVFNREAITGWLFILPALVGFVLFYLLPSVRAFSISFTDWNLLRPPRPVGLENYEALLADPNFWHALKVTGLYVLFNIPLQTVLALLLAVLMDRLVRSIFVRAVVILPYLLSNVVVAMIFLWLLHPILGYVNVFLGLLGLERQPFFGSPDQALATVAGVNIWRHMGFTALLFYAGLQSIPRSLYEAAAIDGAGEWRMFWRITLPLLRPVTVFVLVTSVIGSFQIFDTVAVATGGGPSYATRVIVWYIYENAFQFFRMGYASAMSMVLFLILVAFTLIQMRVFRANQSDLS